MKKSPLNKLVLESLEEPFYLNVATFKNDKGWFPCWEDKYYGSTRKLEAVKLRREWLNFLRTYGNPDWSEKDLKTVKIEYYKFI